MMICMTRWGTWFHDSNLENYTLSVALFISSLYIVREIYTFLIQVRSYTLHHNLYTSTQPTYTILRIIRLPLTHYSLSQQTTNSIHWNVTRSQHRNVTGQDPVSCRWSANHSPKKLCTYSVQRYLTDKHEMFACWSMLMDCILIVAMPFIHDSMDPWTLS